MGRAVNAARRTHRLRLNKLGETNGETKKTKRNVMPEKGPGISIETWRFIVR